MKTRGFSDVVETCFLCFVMAAVLLFPGDVPSQEERSPLRIDVGEDLMITCAWIPAGTFTMGSPETEEGRQMDEGPTTAVTISEGFYMGRTEVTVGQYRQFLLATERIDGVEWADPNCPLRVIRRVINAPLKFELTGSRFGKSMDQPMIEVSWYGAVAFCEWLSQKTNYQVELPTEAQWEYACRGGTQSVFFFGEGEYYIRDYGWYLDNSEHSTQIVAQKKANPFGLYDMGGNAWEWCRDYYGKYPGFEARDWFQPEESDFRVIRGGSWYTPTRNLRSATRNWNAPDDTGSAIGFRIVIKEPQ